MKKIDCEKLFYSVILGILLSLCVMLIGIVIVAYVKLIFQSFESIVAAIIFILLVIGLTYWIYKKEP